MFSFQFFLFLANHKNIRPEFGAARLRGVLLLQDAGIPYGAGRPAGQEEGGPPAQQGLLRRRHRRHAPW